MEQEQSSLCYHMVLSKGHSLSFLLETTAHTWNNHFSHLYLVYSQNVRLYSHYLVTVIITKALLLTSTDVITE